MVGLAFCFGAFDQYLGSLWSLTHVGFWAAESREPATAGRFLGFIGLGYATFLPQLAHRVEIGWRLGRAAWGRGLATEGDGMQLFAVESPHVTVRRLAEPRCVDEDGIENWLQITR